MDDHAQQLMEFSDGPRDILVPKSSDGLNPETNNDFRKVRRHKLILNFCLMYAFFGIGLLLAMLGPTLIDLSEQTGSSLESVTYSFTARSVGYLIGSIVGGEIFDRVANPCTMISSCLFVAALSSFLVPLMPNVASLCCTVVFQGLGMGVLDTGGNVLILK